LTKGNFIYQIGPIPGSAGGIATVIGLYMDRYPSSYHMKMIGTYAGKVRWDMYGWAMLRVIWICLTEKKPLFHIHISKGGSCIRKIMIASVCKFFGKPYVLHIHSGAFLDYIRRQKPIVRRYLFFIFNHSARIVTLSDYWQQVYGQIFQASLLTVIPNPCPTVLHQLPLRDHPAPTVLFLGLLTPAKGVYDLIDAVKLSAGKVEYQVRIFGDGEIARTVAYAAGLDNISVFPWADRARMAAEYLQADIFVLPSYIEGLPMVILEAMGSGLPVVATRVGGVPEIVREGYNGYLIEPGDVAALAEKMLTLVENQKLRQEMGRNALGIIKEKYTLDKLDQEIDRLYGSLGYVQNSGGG